jgi:hypothetical protein
MLTKAVVFSRLRVPDIDDGTQWEHLSIEEMDVADDIKSFTSAKLDTSPKLRNHRAKDRLLNTLIHGSEGMILWVRLMISELENNHWNVDAVLKKLLKGLSAVYNGIL